MKTGIPIQPSTRHKALRSTISDAISGGTRLPPRLVSQVSELLREYDGVCETAREIMRRDHQKITKIEQRLMYLSMRIREEHKNRTVRGHVGRPVCSQRSSPSLSFAINPEP